MLISWQNNLRFKLSFIFSVQLFQNQKQSKMREKRLIQKY